MIYRKITVRFKYFPTRLSRKMYVRADLDLFTLGVAILATLDATFEHYFVFHDKRKRFVPENFEEFFDENEDFMTNYYFAQLSNKFVLEYDTGDGWEFEIKVSERPFDIRSRKFVHLIDGVGQGIWEDNMRSLYAYLSGELSSDDTEENLDKGYCLPWNFSNEKYGDFDQPLDIDEKNESMQQQIEMHLAQLEEQDYF